MRTNFKYYFIRSLAILGLAGMIFAGLRLIERDVFTISITLKSLNSLPVVLEYEGSEKRDIKINRFLPKSLESIQLHYNITDFKYLKHLKLYLGDTVNTIYIEAFSISKSHLSRIEYLYNWKGIESVEKIIQGFSNCTISDETSRYIQIETHTGLNYIEFNMKAFEDKLVKYKSMYVTLKYAVLSMLISMFLCLSYWLKSKAPEVNINPQHVFKLNAVSVLFLIILFLIGLNSIYPVIPDLKNAENRTLYSRPVISLHTVFQYPDLLTKYIQDHFAFRNALVYLNSFIHLVIFKTSSLPDIVLAGKEGWLYITINDAMTDYRRMTRIDTATSPKIIEPLIQRAAWLKKRNCKFYLFVPPNKERIYPEYIPSSHSSKGTRYNSYDYYKELFQSTTKIHLIDPSDSLLSGKKKHFVYYSNDTHWNKYGAYKGYQALMAEIKKSFPDLEIIQESDLIINESVEPRGDLTALLGLTVSFPRRGYFIQLRDTTVKLNYEFRNDPIFTLYRNKTIGTSKLKLLIIGDSYSIYLIPFLSAHFKECVIVRNNYFMPDLIEKEKPDIVILESLERLLPYNLAIPNPTKIENEIKLN